MSKNIPFETTPILCNFGDKGMQNQRMTNPMESDVILSFKTKAI